MLRADDIPALNAILSLIKEGGARTPFLKMIAPPSIKGELLRDLIRQVTGGTPISGMSPRSLKWWLDRPERLALGLKAWYCWERFSDNQHMAKSERAQSAYELFKRIVSFTYITSFDNIAVDRFFTLIEFVENGCLQVRTCKSCNCNYLAVRNDLQIMCQGCTALRKLPSRAIDQKRLLKSNRRTCKPLPVYPSDTCTLHLDLLNGKRRTKDIDGKSC